ncbi:MAG TPA: hypothetical protein VEW26_10055 [Allosphingosinicella sp.]|nr:hypothetical protein [Allosphingosinicella sp.]
MRAALAAILAAGLGACVTPLAERPTGDIFEEAVRIGGYGFMCSAPDGIWFDERLRPLLPWLEARLGKDEVERVLSGMEMTLATTDFTTCPTREQRIRSRIQARRLLRHLEARSKR